MPAVAGLFRANHGYSRAIENSHETLWARFERLERERQNDDEPEPVAAVRLLQPEFSPDTTIIEDHFGLDPDQLAQLLPGVGFLSLMSEYHRKSAERHGYTWRDGGRVRRRVYVHHNYQEPGWHWHATGEMQPWEDGDRIGSKRISRRCDRALMIDYAGSLGCALHGPLAGGEWTRAVMIHEIAEGDLREAPAPIDWGEDHRRSAITAGFGRGEEDITFQGLLAENRFFACLKSYADETLAAIRKTRSAKRLLEVMKARDTAPDWQDKDCVDQGLWEHALRHAYLRFPDALEILELEALAKTDTQGLRYALNDRRLRSLKASVSEQPS